MKLLIFNDSQSIEVQAVHQEGDNLRIRLIHATPDELKTYFKDEFLTRKMTLKEGMAVKAVYENYTVFSYVLEDAGGIMEVGMIQEGKDPATRLTEVEAAAAEAKEKAEANSTDLLMAIAELSMVIAGLTESITGGGENGV